MTETLLQEKIIIELEAQGYQLVKREYEFYPGYSQYGKGDLLFSRGEDEYLLIETKYIDLDSSGHTACRRRTKHRKEVRVQAEHYADILGPVLDSRNKRLFYGYATNEKKVILGQWTGTCEGWSSLFLAAPVPPTSAVLLLVDSFC